ncbi:uncharacterized protein LOC130785128 isoform X1 [Actinidia eriantha]|uniref:uncharacterized protein LOC130785128 isoform X1 n=1 Tax=Actinidia eriantha TaxID=165200 RepID=UPI002590487C|nr:uncharacterized protein LOC130785128 isoform X1 [Actinidia eriantha]
MQVVPRWRNLLVFKDSTIQSLTLASSSSTHLASFHSTPFCFEKWKNKWNSDEKRGQQPSKNYIRYETRQKRADAKRALKDLLFNSGSSKVTYQNYFPRMDETTNWNTEHADHSEGSDKKSRSKSSARRAAKALHKRMKRKLRRESFSEDLDEHSRTTFQATFGNRWYTWSFKSWEESFLRNSTNGFEWRDDSNWTNSRNRKWNNPSDIESNDESCAVGSASDRTILGLSTKGPLKMEDVKNAFRLSALKWHPDKHQGSSQAVAEEKFKLCVNAYKSLCSAISSA